MAPTFGLTINQVDNEPRSAVAADLSTIGLIVTAPTANATTFPLNTPVLINSNADLTDLGTTGSFLDQIEMIDAQMSGFSATARIVIVRADEGVDDDATIANIVADAIPALEDAEQLLGVAPRLIGVPGFTHQQATPTTANPVVAALPGTLEKLVGMAVVSGPHSSLQAYTDWRSTMDNDRLIPVETWVKPATNPTIDTDSVGAILGLIVARDNANNGVPSRSAANRAIQGIVNVNRPIQFSTVDGNTEGQQILALNGGIIVRGQAGSVTSLGTGGFTYVGTDTAQDATSLWLFYNVKRMRDYIHLLFLRTLRDYLGKFNLTAQTIEAILQTMKLALRDLEADNDILGFRVGFDPDKNSAANLRLGRFSLYFKAEEPPVLRRLDIDSFRYAEALDDLVENLIAAA